MPCHTSPDEDKSRKPDLPAQTFFRTENSLLQTKSPITPDRDKVGRIHRKVIKMGTEQTKVGTTKKHAEIFRRSAPGMKINVSARVSCIHMPKELVIRASLTVFSVNIVATIVQQSERNNPLRTTCLHELFLKVRYMVLARVHAILTGFVLNSRNCRRPHSFSTPLHACIARAAVRASLETASVPRTHHAQVFLENAYVSNIYAETWLHEFHAALIARCSTDMYAVSVWRCPANQLIAARGVEWV